MVDTQGPRVTSVVLDPLTGQVRVTFSDPVGLDSTVLSNTASFVLTNPRTGRPYPVVGVAPGGPLGLPSDTVTFRIPRHRAGTYRLTLSSAGLVDLLGRPLKETTFVGPTGDYLAQFVTNGRTPAGPQVGPPAPARPHHAARVHVRRVAHRTR